MKMIIPFKEGFDRIINAKILSHYIMAEEIGRLTVGVTLITSENVLKILSIQGSETHKSMLKRYINESSLEMLQKLLKFTTGSSSIPFETSNYKVYVRFVSSMEIQKLPISHTCSNTLEIPCYISYDQLNAKLTIAFMSANEGFGFL